MTEARCSCQARFTDLFSTSSVQGLEKLFEFPNGQACLSDDRTQRPLGNFLMVGNGQASVWWGLLPQNHVATALPVEHITDLTHSIHHFATRNDRHCTHGLTSTTSSVMGGGMGKITGRKCGSGFLVRRHLKFIRGEDSTTIVGALPNWILVHRVNVIVANGLLIR